MEKWRKRSVDLITSIALGSRDNPAVIPYTPAKTALPAEEMRFFKRSVPEKFGISSKRLYAMLCELEGEPRANIHNLMVIAGGEVICECSRDGYDINMWHLSHSMSKSVTSMVVGLLVEEGRLDVKEKIVDIFPELTYKDKRFSAITVEHLLTMQSGVSFNEAGSVTEEKWSESFFASSLRFNPGTKFQYNSMNSYMLARIVDKRTKDGFGAFAREKLFHPLSIYNYFWEKSPEGTEKGGWGLYISAESFAKFGVLFMSRGEFFGKRIISREWIDEMGVTRSVSPEISGDFNYGYQTWVARNSDEKLFNGMLGQDVWICPRNNLIAVINGGNNELFQESAALEIIRKYLGGEIRDELERGNVKALHEKETKFFDCRRWVRPKEKRRGLLYFLGLRYSASFDTKWDAVLGTYAFGANNVGMLPLIVRTMQNNLDSTLEKMALYRVDSELYLSFWESGTHYVFGVGMYEYRTTVLDFRGEKYIVKAMGEPFMNADGVMEYRIELVFPELPNTRRLRIIRLDGERISIDFEEIPNHRIVENLILRISEMNAPLSIATDIIERKFGHGVVVNTVKRTFAPTLRGADMSAPNYLDTVKAETRRAEEETRVVRLIRGVVDRFFKDSPEEEEEKAPEKKAKKKNIISGIVERISNKKAR